MVTYWSTWQIDLLNCNKIWFNGQSDSQSVQDTLYDECSWDWWSIDPLSARIAYFEGLYARLLPQDGETLKIISRLRIDDTYRLHETYLKTRGRVQGKLRDGEST